VFGHDCAMNFAHDDLGLEATAGKDTLANMRGANPNQSKKSILLGVENGRMGHQ